jgi:hypothetical protein
MTKIMISIINYNFFWTFNQMIIKTINKNNVFILQERMSQSSHGKVFHCESPDGNLYVAKYFDQFPISEINILLKL